LLKIVVLQVRVVFHNQVVAVQVEVDQKENIKITRND